jgi:endo-1,4-beta-xylanase
MRKLLVLLVLCSACGQEVTSDCAQTALKLKAGFPIGTAFNLAEYQFEPLLVGAFEKHFNSFTPENALKFSSVRPLLRNSYDFSEADALINIAQANNARIHGHTLLWHQQMPFDFEQYEGDYHQLMQTHINTVVKRYTGIIKSWDVVNEGLNEQGDLRVTPWFEKLGDDYIFQAFSAAQDANPEADLFYNDYNLVLNPRKLDGAIRLCNSLREQGIKNVGIGLQMHIATDLPLQIEMAKAVEKIWRAGFKVHFSEVDVSVNILGSKNAFEASDYQRQAAKYREVVEVYEQIPSQYQFGITFWGIGDADSWIPSYFNRADAPMLFDENYQPKPAFCAFLEAL